MITVLAGDFKKDDVAAFRKSMCGLGKPTNIVFSKGFLKNEAIPLDDIVSVEQVNESGLNAGAAIAGGLMFGLAGAAIGALAGSGKVVAIGFRDGRKALVKCGGQDMAVLLGAAFGKTPEEAV